MQNRPFIRGLDSKLDRSRKTALSIYFWYIMEQFGLADVWRSKNLKRNYHTFFTDQHQTCSRFVLILASPSIFQNIASISLGPRIYFDLAYIDAVWQTAPAKLQGSHYCRLDSFLLGDEEVRKIFKMRFGISF